MSKLSFRARALDVSKPMPIFLAEELPDLPECSINRSVPQMPTGMEKEEECEHHLQRAISARQVYGAAGDLVIPTPDVFEAQHNYNTIYPADYKIPRQLIHMQPFAIDNDLPDYDMDSEDENWYQENEKKMNIDSLQFENMMEQLETSSGQLQVLTLKEARLLLQGEAAVIEAVYDYWLNKRLKLQHSLMPTVKTDKVGGSNNNPYVAFRKRTEKMQTRKNRKNEESGYERMLKLRRDLTRAVTLLEMVKRREKMKYDQLKLTLDIFQKRHELEDWNGQMLTELSTTERSRSSYSPLYTPQPQGTRVLPTVTPKKDEVRKEKKKKRGPKPGTSNIQMTLRDVFTSSPASKAPTEDVTAPTDEESDGEFAFRRKKMCQYQAPREGGLAWCEEEPEDARLKYHLATIHTSYPGPYRDPDDPPLRQCVGLARRRMGRGGRVWLDRAGTSDDHYRNCGYSILETPSTSDCLKDTQSWRHFRPRTPPVEEYHEPTLYSIPSTFRLEVEGDTDSTVIDLASSELCVDSGGSPSRTPEFATLPSSQFTISDKSPSLLVLSSGSLPSSTSPVTCLTTSTTTSGSSSCSSSSSSSSSRSRGTDMHLKVLNGPNDATPKNGSVSSSGITSSYSLLVSLPQPSSSNTTLSRKAPLSRDVTTSIVNSEAHRTNEDTEKTVVVDSLVLENSLPMEVT